METGPTALLTLSAPVKQFMRRGFFASELIIYGKYKNLGPLYKFSNKEEKKLKICIRVNSIQTYIINDNILLFLAKN